MNKYFYTDGKSKFGPFSKEELSNQNISKETKVWCYGMEQWTDLSQAPDLKDIMSSIPPALNPKSTSEKELKSIPVSIKKNKISDVKKWLSAIAAIALLSIIAY